MGFRDQYLVIKTVSLCDGHLLGGPAAKHGKTSSTYVFTQSGTQL